MKKIKKTYSGKGASKLLAIGSALDNSKLSLKKRAQRFRVSKSLLQKLF